MLHALENKDEDEVKDFIPTYKADDRDDFGSAINSFLQTLNSEDLEQWHILFNHCATTQSSKPSKKWLEKANNIINQLTIKQYKSVIYTFFEVAENQKIHQISFTHDFFGPDRKFTQSIYLREKNRALLKGLIWSTVRFHDSKTLLHIFRLTEKCYYKIPYFGQAATATGNAGVYVLAQTKGMEGIGYLSQLKIKIRLHSSQKLITQYLEQQAKKRGLLVSQIEELAIPNFGLCLGELRETFDDYQLRLHITGVGKAELQWIKPDGKTQKSAPAFIKNNARQTSRLKKIRELVKQIKSLTTTQRDRIDRLYLERRIWSYEEFNKFYFNHGLVCTLTRKLIWLFETKNGWTAVFWHNKQWLDLSDNVVDLNRNTRIRLWHPIDLSAEEVLQWRIKLEKWQVQQPMKQAYREIYLLTDAEKTTGSYSNRMAAHFLKQHQFNALAALRGWRYSLQGSFNNEADSQIAEKYLSSDKIFAQFWVYELTGSAETNQSGIWSYVATDQIRFVNADREPIDLIDVDKLLFSEIMRDVDLFVGVASVGNDAQWQDRGEHGNQQQYEYWQNYSFGDLSEISKTRKQVLERLLPRLTIQDVAHIDGRFLVVKGKLHTYKIHIGSTHVLISPNDQYLCIVAAQGKDKKLKNVFLPFEGDRGLSIILSKAFLLAEDNKITDKTILSQI